MGLVKDINWKERKVSVIIFCYLLFIFLFFKWYKVCVINNNGFLSDIIYYIFMK